MKNQKSTISLRYVSNLRAQHIQGHTNKDEITEIYHDLQFVRKQSPKRELSFIKRVPSILQKSKMNEDELQLITRMEFPPSLFD
uniref:Uncharacterized protein n=1 Tax=Spironucleus salmonicida TaxID=348837 RepID=V6LR08_9EUKA|eukprot:EST47117.1 Hypothetical protein SS50377_12826 [Spironucleus salmonicida]